MVILYRRRHRQPRISQPMTAALRATELKLMPGDSWQALNVDGV